MQNHPNPMDLTPLQIEVIEQLRKIEEWQINTQGQVSALRVALAACLSFPQMSEALRNHARLHLEARLAAMKQDAVGLAESDGFASVLRELMPDSGSQGSSGAAH